MRLVVFVGMAVLLFSLCLLFAGPDQQEQRSTSDGTEPPGETAWREMEINEWQESIEDEVKLAEKPEFFWMMGFCKPHSLEGRDALTYIWTLKDVYLVGEPVPIYVETVAKKRLYVIQDPEGDLAIVDSNLEYDSLIVKHSKYGYLDKVGTSPCFGFTDNGQLPFADVSEIDFSRLHGRFRSPVRKEEWIGKPWVIPSFDKGDCYVRKIGNLLEHIRDMRNRYFWKDAVPQGRWKMVPDTRGVYRVQHDFSNIIEFEIR